MRWPGRGLVPWSGAEMNPWPVLFERLDLNMYRSPGSRSSTITRPAFDRVGVDARSPYCLRIREVSSTNSKSTANGEGPSVTMCIVCIFPLVFSLYCVCVPRFR